MTFSYQNTRRDFVAACIAMSRKAYWFLFGFWLLLAVFSLWLYFEVFRGSTRQRLTLLLPVTICGLMFLLIAWAAPRLRARRMILREVTWTFSEEGVHLTSDVSNSDLRWEAYLKYRETQKGFLLFVQRGMAQFIPKRALTTQQADDLRALITAHVKAS